MKYEIQSGVRHIFEYTTLSKYYPTRYAVEQEYIDVRSFIFAFKNGITGEAFGKKLSNMIVKTAFQPRVEWWICIIPASTQIKTTSRFEKFCSELSLGTSMNNGYELVFNTADRNAIHSQAERNSININESIGYGDVKGKKILLFDDIYTTGTSFVKVANKLIQLGAIEVQGMFLGKTSWLD